jgi:hypothetical protein
MKLQPLAMPIPRTADVIGHGITKTKELIRDGILETVVSGHRRLVLYASAERYIESLRGQGGDPRRNTAVPKAGERRPRKAETPA